MSYALGVDVSRYQGKMDWPVCRAAGSRFAYMRCTLLGSDNVLGTDWEWERNADLAPQHMDCTGAYHAVRPTKPGHEQADYFLERYSKVEFNLPVWLDAEANEAGVSPSVYANIAEEFCIEILAAGYRIMPYTRAEWWKKNIGSKLLWPTLDLCIARYTGLPKPWGNPDDPSWLTPRDWDDWRFWQYSADGNGRGPEFGAESDDIDIDWFNGDETALLEYAGVEPLPPEPPPLPPPPPIPDPDFFQELPMYEANHDVQTTGKRIVEGLNEQAITVPEDEYWILQWVGATTNFPVQTVSLNIKLAGKAEFTPESRPALGKHNWIRHPAVYTLPAGSQITLRYTGPVTEQAQYTAIRYFAQKRKVPV